MQRHMALVKTEEAPGKSYRVSEPMMGRVAYWNARGRAMNAALYEGMPGFGRRVFAYIDRMPDGTWMGRYLHEPPAMFPSREEALQTLSRRAFDDFDLEIRTTARVIIQRPDGIVEKD
jgi:hypothetical protein